MPLRGLASSGMARERRARVTDVEQLALGLPEVTRDPADPTAPGRPAYQVRGKTFAFFRGPRKDARDPATGEPYEDVMAFSCSGLIHQLSSSAGDKYTVEQATYGAEQSGIC